jgi:hypothetical protein
MARGDQPHELSEVEIEQHPAGIEEHRLDSRR